MTYVEEAREAFGERPLLLAGAGVIATDPDGRLLLQQRSDDGSWSIVGGYLEIGESPQDALRRELREEVDLEVGELRLFGVFAGADYFHDYPGKGRVYGVNIVYLASGVTGTPRADQDEANAARFFEPDKLPSNLQQTAKLILERYLVSGEHERMRSLSQNG